MCIHGLKERILEIMFPFLRNILTMDSLSEMIEGPVIETRKLATSEQSISAKGDLKGAFKTVRNVGNTAEQKLSWF